MKKICIFILVISFVQISVLTPYNLVWAKDDINETNEIMDVENSDDDENDESVGYSTRSVIHDYTETGEQEGRYRSNIYQYDNFMESYFDNLTTNHGGNTIGSCGYVAIDMLLCYYDTYLNDDIVPEDYDVPSTGNCYNMICRRNSPGSMFDKPKEYNSGYYTNNEVQKNIDYFNYINKIKEDSLHAKLLTLGASIVGVNYPELWPSLNHIEMEVIIMKYMSDVLGFNYDDEYHFEGIVDRTLNFNDSDDVRAFVIEKIGYGFPVLVWIESEGGSESGSGSGDKDSHWVVAYDYDETTDKIYCHFGWEKDSTHVTPENYVEELDKNPEKNKNYTIYKSALVINFTLPHKCSNNYIVTSPDGNQISYCPCEEEIELYSDTPTFISKNAYKHQLSLSCECDTLLNHVWNQANNEDGHSYICKFCNEEKLISHLFVHTAIDNLQHLSECINNTCEMEFTYDHNWEFVSINDTSHMATCGDCGYTETKYHTFECDGTENGLHYEKCVDCGYRENMILNAQYSSIGDAQHTKSCSECGYATQVDHYFIYKSTGALSHILTCKYCGITSGTESGHMWISTENTNYVKCKHCDYLKFQGGGFTPIIKTKIPKKEETE